MSLLIGPEQIVVETPKELHVFPPFGAPGVCTSYDEDCFKFPAEFHRICAEYVPSEGPCPFVD